MQTAIVYVFFAVFGACIGSLVNVLIARLPIKGGFFKNSRSICPNCKKQLKFYDLIPILSYFILLGKCRYCKKRISISYPIVEVFGAGIAVFCLYVFSISFLSLIVFFTVMILLAVSFIDFHTSEIPFSLVLALVPFAIASIWLLPNVTLLSHVVGFFSISLPMLLLTLFIKGAFGGGDIKLIAVCGFMLGWQLTLLAFFIALLSGGVCAIFLMITRRRKRGQHMVFGPAICLGVTVSLFYGSELIHWYLSLFPYVL